jgi:hypothetical protein
VARPGTIVVFGSRRSTSGEAFTLVDRLPPPRMIQSGAVTAAST